MENVLTWNRYNYCVSSYLNYQDPSGYDGELYYLNNIDGAKVFGHNAILVVDSEGEGTFFTYMTGEGTMTQVLKGNSVMGYMDEVALSKEEVEKFLSNGEITVTMAGGESNYDEYDQALKKIITDDEVETVKTNARKYVSLFDEYIIAGDKEAYKETIPLYNFYLYNCDTVASKVINSIDKNFAVCTVNIDMSIWNTLTFPLGLTIASPNVSFLYSKELCSKDWGYINIDIDKKETFILGLCELIKNVRIIVC